MRRKSLNIFLLAFTALWLGVIVPVHARGLIRLPGSEVATKSTGSVATDAHACCSTSRAPTSESPPVPCGDDKQSCAICYFIATLDLPPVDDISLAPVGIVEPAFARIQQAAPSLDYLLPIHGRAPPIA